MNNPILNTLNQSNLNNARRIVDMMRSARDPNQFLHEMAKTNQNVKQVVDLVNRTGDARSAFYQMAAAKGVDPEAILSMIRK